VFSYDGTGSAFWAGTSSAISAAMNKSDVIFEISEIVSIAHTTATEEAKKKGAKYFS